MEKNKHIKTILDGKNHYNYSEKSNILSLYYADKKNIEHNVDFNNYVEIRIKEFLKDENFLLYQLDKVEGIFANKSFFSIEVNENYAFMASLKVNLKAVEVKKLIGFIFDFEQTVFEHHGDRKKEIVDYLDSFSNTLLDNYNDHLIKKPYFSSMAEVYKNLIRTSSNFKAHLELDFSERKPKLNPS